MSLRRDTSLRLDVADKLAEYFKIHLGDESMKKKRGRKPDAGTPQATQASKVRAFREILSLLDDCDAAIRASGSDTLLVTLQTKLKAIRRRATTGAKGSSN